MSRAKDKGRIYRVPHAEPGVFRTDYILLPYGEYYAKTAELLKANTGDIIRFFDGRDAEIQSVKLIEDPELCTILCRMRYGITWPVAFSRWRRYAVLEGNGKYIIVEGKCIMVTFKYHEEKGDTDS